MQEIPPSDESKEVVKEIDISLLTQNDVDILPELVQLLRDGIMDIPQSETDQQASLARNTMETCMKRLEREGECFLYVARDENGKIIGCTYGIIRSKENVPETFKTVGHFGLTVVHPEYRNKKIGQKLKAEFEKECSKRGIPTMTTFIKDDNKPSIGMNLRLGYTEITNPAFSPVDGGRYYAKQIPLEKE